MEVTPPPKVNGKPVPKRTPLLNLDGPPPSSIEPSPSKKKRKRNKKKKKVAPAGKASS
jgi:hypothetical protein